MGPTIPEVMRRRYWAGVVLRAAGAILVLWSVFSVWAFAFVALIPFGRVGNLIGGPELWSRLLPLAIGTFLIVLERRIAAWLLPFPKPGCPGCGYPVTSTMPRCPECGLALETGPGRAPTPSPASRAAP